MSRDRIFIIHLSVGGHFAVVNNDTLNQKVSLHSLFFCKWIFFLSKCPAEDSMHFFIFYFWRNLSPATYNYCTISFPEFVCIFVSPCPLQHWLFLVFWETAILREWPLMKMMPHFPVHFPEKRWLTSFHWPCGHLHAFLWEVVIQIFCLYFKLGSLLALI